MTEIPAPICPECGRPGLQVQSKWGIKHVCCNRWSYGGKPLALKEVHQARQAAHDHFDKLWKGDKPLMGRSKAYHALANELGITGAECHFALMDIPVLARIPAAVETIKARIARTPPLCGCGNALSVKRQLAGKLICPQCEDVNEAKEDRSWGK